MSFETIRINELAKELGLTNKEVIDKFNQLSITGKTHSSTVTLDQVNRLKEFIKDGSVKQIKKPKVFVVKKSKIPEQQVVVKQPEKVKPEVEEKEIKTEIKRPKVEVVKPKSRLEIVRRAPQRPSGEDRPNR